MEEGIKERGGAGRKGLVGWGRVVEVVSETYMTEGGGGRGKGKG